VYSEPEGRRSNLAGTVFLIAVGVIMAYLALAALQGRHGVFSLLRVEAEEERLKAELGELQLQRESVANKTHRLSTETIDQDILDEEARRVLGLGRPNEIILP
jgi:cell division protein FtsB